VQSSFKILKVSTAGLSMSAAASCTLSLAAATHGRTTVHPTGSYYFSVMQKNAAFLFLTVTETRQFKTIAMKCHPFTVSPEPTTTEQSSFTRQDLLSSLGLRIVHW